MAESIGSFSFDVTKRILSMLFQDGPTKKTNLATKTGLNYNVCVRYIKMLQLLGWLDVSTDISITETGRNVMRRLRNQTSDNNIDVVQDSNEKAYSHEDDIKQFSSQLTEQSSNKFDQDPQYKPCIMIVDDEPDVLVTYESFLFYKGFDIKSFTDSYKALRAFTSEPKLYDLVILDIRMENLNGLQLYQCMKALNPSSKIIFASALDAAKELTTMLPGITSQEIIKKPIDKENFLRSIKIALGK
ncbi:MAG TPA: response regulator [Nitrososphaeraceae archaeon]|jgi:CheY-like chemotaxis protein/predicted transcriptional regulator|nr:response regulator [Nitrososphaeraceae archaeon]